jgi:hypothetical protein
MGIDGLNQYAHRLAWLWMIGEWPAEEIDHIDGNPLNNRWKNLRLATRGENQFNRGADYTNTSGYKGVTYHKQCRKWVARIGHKRKSYHLGLFETAKTAHAAYCEAAIRLHGEFARLK